ncbi:MAG: glycosyltransferase family 4 protein [Burkholderiales bacterium]|nr:glycosyltransferase family 4 protein [Burkholderiales bacterium]
MELVQVNGPYRPACVGRVPGLRAVFRLVPYLFRVWRAAGRADLLHVMANSGWSWHLFAAPAIWAGALLRTPVVVNYRGGEAQAFLQRSAKYVLPTMSRASKLIVPSGFLRRIFAGHGICAEIVPNIVDLTRFFPEPRGNRSPHLVVTRNLEEIYDLPTAIRAFTRVRAVSPAARLTIAGTGPCRTALENLCARLGVADAVSFAGRVENEAIPALYRSADLMLNPSTVDNMPISLLEAMASGVPVVSTDVGGIPDLVRNGETALLVPARDPDAMAAAAIRVISDPALARSLVAAGLERARAYAWPRVKPELFGAYARALADCGHRTEAAAADRIARRLAHEGKDQHA